MCKKKQFKYCPSEIDECMRYKIEELNKRGEKTLACCCGHKKYPASIIVPIKVDGYDVGYELYSRTIIPRIRNFYKKDELGYYYIPEVSKPNFKTKIIKRKNSASIIRRKHR